MITAAMIDSREPEWVKGLTFDFPTSVTMLETGDFWAATDDGQIIMVERKTPDDFLGSLRDERLIPQVAKLAEARQMQQLKGERPTHWPYLVITDPFLRGSGGKVATPERGLTGWNWSAVQGALLTIQEMGVFIEYSAGPEDYAACVKRLGERKRDDILDLLPARQPNILGPREAFLACLPGIGVDRVMGILRWGGTAALALVGLVDLSIDCPVEGIGKGIRQKIRDFLGLKDNETIELMTKEATE